MTDPRDIVAAHSHLRRYVLANERVVVATRRHWALLLEPIATTFVSFLLVGAASEYVGLRWLWVAWLVVLGRLVWKWLQWFHEWFVATDKRLILAYGLVIHRVAMMPLLKVTDMGYSRTPVGQILGYGRFVMESAGQDQALRQVDWVPNPDDTYRKLCATIFLPGQAPGGPRPPQQNGDRPNGDRPHGDRRPPALLPGNAEPRPITQPIPVVGRAGHVADPGTERGPSEPAPDRGTPYAPWTPGGSGDRFPRPPEGTGGGPTIPKPYL